MAQPQFRSDLDPEIEYKAIEKTLLESPRGRWFLSEHGRRARRLDTLTLHEAIHKLQDSLREPPALLGQLRSEIESLQQLLRETRTAITAKQAAVASSAQTAGVSADATGSAQGAVSGGASGAGAPAMTGSANILSVAESIHELAWDLQAQDLNVEACEQIARQASQMYALSHRHAVESERVKALTEVLDGALLRLDGLLETVALEAQFDTFNPVPTDDDGQNGAATEAQPLGAPGDVEEASFFPRQDLPNAS